MPFNLTGLQTYTDQVGAELISEALLLGQSFDLCDIKPNIKHAEAINVFDQNLVVQISNCATAGFSDPSGNTSVLTQRILTVCPTKVNSSWCIYGTGGIEDYWLGFLNKPGQYHNEIAQFDKFLRQITKRWAQQLDYAIWQAGYGIATSSAHSGDTSAVSTYPWIASCTGFLSNIYNTSDSAVTTFVAYTAATVANILGVVDQVCANIDQDILLEEDLVIWTSPALTTMYQRAERNANGYNYYPTDGQSVITGGDGSLSKQNLRVNIPGTTITLVGTVGLTNLTNFILGQASNFAIGCDLVGDWENMFQFYSEDFDTLRLVGRMKIGTQTKFPNQITVL